MRCWYCDTEARGVCRFCGAGVCEKHFRGARHVSGVAAQGQRGWGTLPSQWYDYVMTENAIWCGQCKMQPHSSR